VGACVAPADLARAVTTRQVLSALGVRARNSKRADCPVCRGNSARTLAFTERLWHCHRCKEGGDVFSLVRIVNRCNFSEALMFVAKLAGIRLEGRHNADFQRQLGTTEQQRARLSDAAAKLSAIEHSLLLEYRDRIHKAEHTRIRVGERLAELSRGELERFRGEREDLWLKLKAANVLLATDIPAYTMLTFGTFQERVQFVLHPELRDEMIAAIRWAGYIRTRDGKQIEVPA
jgi:CHC2 zinc finger